jgi:tetratricopeptide (TPR) repeat protein
MARVAAALLVALAVATAAAAPPPADEADAGKIHYQAGRQLYELGRYSEAIAEFQLGYESTLRPAFLLNIGQAYRRLGNLEKARLYIRQYLSTQADDAESHAKRIEAQSMLASLEERPAPPGERSAAGSALGDNRPPLVEPSAPPVEPRALPGKPALELSAAPQPRFWRRFWWIVPVAAIVLAGAAVGIALGVTSHGERFTVVDLR